MSTAIATENDLAYNLVENVSYSASPAYTGLDKTTTAYLEMYSMLDKGTATAQNTEEQPLPKEQLKPVSCAPTENSKKTDTPKVKKRGNIVAYHIALLVANALSIAGGGALIAAFVQISKLSAEVALLQSTTSSMETTFATTANIARLVESIQELDSNTKTHFNNLDIVLKNSQDNSNARDQFFLEFISEAGHAFDSCAAIWQLFPFSPSGNYHIRSANGSAVPVYCDMARSCGGITGGWMRVAELDMTDTTSQCPSGLTLFTSPRRTCRIKSSSSPLCSSDKFTVGGVGYSKVCGRVRAYQFGSPDDFENGKSYIESNYVDGVSLTHGRSPRRHIWTFAAALNEDDRNFGSKCACINTTVASRASLTPSFVGEDYFCDTAAISGSSNIFYADDPLWDGAGCGPQNMCCSFNTPPWFYKQLPQATTDDIEMRVCRDQGRSNEDIAIEVVEIYVQ